MTQLLEPGGALDRAIPHYEDRAEQRAMSAAVARALEDSRALVVEAGTGTGKTLAYLIPALQSGKRVIVSTGTRALQDQIARHDIPLLQAMLPKPFSAVVLKGVGNYVCRRKLELARARAPRDDVSLASIADWTAETATGDRAEVEWLGEDSPVWAAVTTTTDARVGPRCPHFEHCFVTQARRLADKAQLILVNHALYLADRAMRARPSSSRRGILPEHDAVIFDEAHQLEDVATEHFGITVSTRRLAELVRDAQLALAGMPLWTGRAGIDAIAAVERGTLALFSALRPAMITAGDSEVGKRSRSPEGSARRLVASETGTDAADSAGRSILPPGLFEHPDRQARWFELDAALEDLARTAEADGDDAPADAEADTVVTGSRAALAGVARRARDLRDDLATIAEQRLRTAVYWGDTRPTSTSLAAAPIEIADLFRRHVVTAGPTPIFTSATLTAGGGFAYTRARLGLPVADVDELAVQSPFDYARQAILYVPRDLPIPAPLAPEAFAAAAALRTRELLAITSGRAFLLFTSHRALAAARARLADLPYPLLVQGDAPRAVLIDRFRATAGAVLLGTASFWEGVDVPGDALSLVVIDKLPFAPHTEPLVAARMAACAEAGGDPFATIQLPAAAIALKQGFGRLIRRRDDRGIVAILDGRIVTKAYGKTFVDTLPAGLPRTSSIEQVKRWWAAVPSPGARDELAPLVANPV